MAFVTLPGASGGIVTVQAGTGAHILVAQLIANTILTASVGGTLNAIQTVTAGSGPTIAPPPTGGTDQSILYLFGSGGGSITIPTGYNYVVDLMTGPETITGSNLQVISFDTVGSTFNVSGNVVLAADPASDNNVVNLSGVFNEATGDGNDTVNAIGTGTVAGGIGTNVFNLTSTVSPGILLQSNGAGDTVNVFGTGSVTVDAAGTHTDITGAAGPLFVLDTGTNDTVGAFGSTPTDVSLLGANGLVFTGSGPLTATVGGTSNTVVGGVGSTTVTLTGTGGDVLGDLGALSVFDNGSADSIGAFTASTASVTLAGSGELVAGGSGSFNVTSDGTGETILGGSGAATISIGSIGISTGDIVNGGTGSLTIDDEGQGDSIGPFGSSPANVTLGASSSLDKLFGGSGNLEATVDGANDTVVGGSGPSTITANSSAVVFGGTGAVTFIGGAVGSVILAGSATTLFGGSGTTTLAGSSGANMVFSSVSGTGGLNFLAGSGNESLDAAGSAASNQFGFFNSLTSVGGGAADTITGWTTSDSLFLVGYDSTQSSTVAGGGNFTFHLQNGASITFTDATQSEFNGKFLYVNPT